MRAKNCSASRVAPPIRAAVGATLATLAALTLAGCKSFGPDRAVAPDVTGSIGKSEPAGAEAALQAELAGLRARHLAQPRDRDVAIAFARALRRNGEAAQAAAVLEKIAILYPKDRAVLSAYGKALIDAGALDRARAVLDGADTPDAPDWSVVNARGVIADRLDDHVAAQSFYRDALRLAPGEPSILSNYGLSLLLSNDRAAAERFLRQAAQNPRADDRVRANLALAEEVAPARNLPPSAESQAARRADAKARAAAGAGRAARSAPARHRLDAPTSGPGALNLRLAPVN